MVTLQSAKAIGSFLGTGTHVWLVIVEESGERTTFSGSKVGLLLGVIKNFKRDYEKPPSRGQILIPPPMGMTDEAWDRAMITAGDEIMEEMNKVLRFRGTFPYFGLGGNCCTIATLIVERAGGTIPKKWLKGFTPGLKKNPRKPVLF